MDLSSLLNQLTSEEDVDRVVSALSGLKQAFNTRSVTTPLEAALARRDNPGYQPQSLPVEKTQRAFEYQRRPDSAATPPEIPAGDIPPDTRRDIAASPEASFAEAVEQALMVQRDRSGSGERIAGARQGVDVNSPEGRALQKGFETSPEAPMIANMDRANPGYMLTAEDLLPNEGEYSRPQRDRSGSGGRLATANEALINSIDAMPGRMMTAGDILAGNAAVQRPKNEALINSIDAMPGRMMTAGDILAGNAAAAPTTPEPAVSQDQLLRDFQITHGGPFDPNSSADAGKLERLKAARARFPDASSNQLALMIYRNQL